MKTVEHDPAQSPNNSTYAPRATGRTPTTLGPPGAYTLAPTEGEILDVVGDTVRVLADSAASGGACTVLEVISESPSGPPTHRHSREDEFFYVIEGTVRVSMNGQERVLGPRSFVCAPRGSVHTFANAGAGELRMLVICTPGGLEVPFRECDRLSREGRAIPLNIEATLKRHGLDFVGPPLGV